MALFERKYDLREKLISILNNYENNFDIKYILFLVLLNLVRDCGFHLMVAFFIFTSNYPMFIANSGSYNRNIKEPDWTAGMK